MLAVTSDTIALPRVPQPRPEAAERPVISVTTAPSGLEGPDCQYASAKPPLTCTDDRVVHRSRAGGHPSG
jgi:hypothetical protein